MVAFFTLVPFAVAFLAVSRTADASPPPGPVSGPVRYITYILPRQLAARQDLSIPPIIPDQCKSTCDGFLKQVSTCASDSDLMKCFCTDSTSDLLASCQNCILEGDKSLANLNSAQDVINNFVDGCKQNGTPVKSQKVDGSSNGALGLAPGVLGVAAIALTFMH